jgi:uncharacterized protein (DUF1501 family)
LLRFGLGPRFIQITYGDWDHHSKIYFPTNISAEPTSIVRTFDAGLGRMIADLRQDSLLDDTLVIVMSEFGRTPGLQTQVNGRDHHSQQAARRG